jgi:hypothetical protein
MGRSDPILMRLERGQLAPVQSAATSQRFSVGVGFETGVTC